MKEVSEQIGIGKNKLLNKLRESKILQSDDHNRNIIFEEYQINRMFQVKTKNANAYLNTSYLLISEKRLNL